MRIPHTIDHNTLLVYEPSVEVLNGKNEVNRILKAEDATWDAEVVPSLATLSTKVVPAILTSVVPCPAREIMLETLPTDLPLSLAVEAIEDNEYWKRRTTDHWNRPNDVSAWNGNWKRFFIEKHTEEFVETLLPDEFAEEQIEQLCELVSDFVLILNISQLQVQRKIFEIEADEDKNDECSDRIDLRLLIAGLKNLTELYLQFSVKNVGSDFQKNIFEFTQQDCRNLGEGIAQSTSIRLLRIHMSSLDDPKLAVLLSQMHENQSLESLEFPNCQISDKGAACLARFLAERPQLVKLDISNNRVGKFGVQALAFVLTQENGSGLIQLNLRFNNFGDDGAQFLLSALQRKAPSLKNLNISCSGMREDSGILLGEVLSKNSCLVYLDVSNNTFGSSAEEAILRGLSTNTSLKFLDLRMTGLSGDVLLEIESILQANRHRDKKNEIFLD